MVKMVVGIVLLVVGTLCGGILVIATVVGLSYWMHIRRLVRNLTHCRCPHCDQAIGNHAAKQAYRNWSDSPPDAILIANGRALSDHFSPYWPVRCDQCGQFAVFDMEDQMVYRGRHIGNNKLHAIADVMLEKDIEHPLPPERLDAICQASGCDRIEVLWVVNKLRRSARDSHAMGASGR